MAKLSNNNRAHKTAYTTLVILHQLEAPWDEAADVKMSELRHFAPSDSSEMREMHARTLAHQIDNVYRMVRGARLEPDMSLNDAIEGMVEILTDGDRTVFDLAQASDAGYRFFGEAAL